MRIRLIALLAAIAFLGGCAMPPKLLTNRLSCTAAGDQVLVSSMYGWIGISSKADTDDAKAILASGCGTTPPAGTTSQKGNP